MLGGAHHVGRQLLQLLGDDAHLFPYCLKGRIGIVGEHHRAHAVDDRAIGELARCTVLMRASLNTPSCRCCCWPCRSRRVWRWVPSCRRATLPDPFTNRMC